MALVLFWIQNSWGKKIFQKCQLPIESYCLLPLSSWQNTGKIILWRCSIMVSPARIPILWMLKSSMCNDVDLHITYNILLYSLSHLCITNSTWYNVNAIKIVAITWANFSLFLVLSEIFFFLFFRIFSLCS